MNKKIGIIAATLIGAIVLGLGVYHSDASGGDPKLSEGDIRKMVSAQYPGKITELELEQELDRVVYEVAVAGESKEYDMEMDGNTGEVLVIREKEMPSNAEETNDGKDVEKRDAQEQNTVNIDEKNKEVSKTADKSNEMLTIVQIEEIALNEFPGWIKEIELDEDDGYLMYEVEVENENREEAELDIDAYTGEILKMEKEYKSGSKHKGSKQFSDDILSIKEIKEIALEEFPGQIKELELDENDGRLIYEVEVKNKGREAEMDIDARTGDVLELEFD